jgi:hypothetical protein
VYRGHLEQGGGDVEIAVLTFGRFDEQGRTEYFEVFEPAALDDALARFEEIGAQTEAERVYTRLARTANARDWEGAGACFAEDFNTVEHRVLAWEPLRGPREVIDVYRSWVGMAPDLEICFEWLGGDADHIVVRWGGQGHAAAETGGGAFEYHFVIVATLRDGLIADTEHFDVGDEEAALARMAEVIRAPPRSVSTREAIARYVDAYNGRDWDSLHDLFSPDLHFIDQRLVGWGEHRGPDFYVDIVKTGRELAPDTRIEVEPVALGMRAAVARFFMRGHFADGGGAFETETVGFTLAGPDGRLTHGEMFDASGTEAAFARFDEIGAQTEAERVYARMARSLNARDWDALRGCLADDAEAIDRRAMGWDTIRGADAFVSLFTSWNEVAPDAELRFETLAGDERHALFRSGGFGHAAPEAGGGPMEYVNLIVVTVCEDRIAAVEQFGEDQQEAAFARLDDLIGS